MKMPQGLFNAGRMGAAAWVLLVFFAIIVTLVALVHLGARPLP